MHKGAPQNRMPADHVFPRVTKPWAIERTFELNFPLLEGRRTRLQERLDGVRRSMVRTRERLDDYTLELQRHGQESVEREVRWLTELIDGERAGNMTHLRDPDKE